MLPGMPIWSPVPEQHLSHALPQYGPQQRVVGMSQRTCFTGPQYALGLPQHGPKLLHDGALTRVLLPQLDCNVPQQGIHMALHLDQAESQVLVLLLDLQAVGGSWMCTPHEDVTEVEGHLAASGADWGGQMGAPSHSSRTDAGGQGRLTSSKLCCMQIYIAGPS